MSGLSEIGVTVSDISEAQLKAGMVAKAQRVVLDHTKIGTSDFAQVRDVSYLDIIVTNEATDRLEKLFRGSQVHLVSAQGNGARHH